MEEGRGKRGEGKGKSFVTFRASEVTFSVALASLFPLPSPFPSPTDMDVSKSNLSKKDTQSSKGQCIPFFGHSMPHSLLASLRAEVSCFPSEAG